jgi:hypothetical protein
MGSLPEKVEVTGDVTLLDKPCLSLSLGLAMLNKKGQIISSRDNQSFPNNSHFRLSIYGKKADYLLLNVRSYDENNVVNSCTSEINSLAVSSQL